MKQHPKPMYGRAKACESFLDGVPDSALDTAPTIFALLDTIGYAANLETKHKAFAAGYQCAIDALRHLLSYDPIGAHSEERDGECK